MEDPVAALFIAILAASAGYFGVTRSSLESGYQAPFMLILCGIATLVAAFWITVNLDEATTVYLGWIAITLAALVVFGNMQVLYHRVQEQKNK